MKYLNVYVEANRTAKALKLTEPYIPMGHTSLPTHFRNATIVWSFASKLTSDMIERVKNKFNAEEIVSKGKPAFLATLTPEQVRDLALFSPSPVQTTPSNETCMNLQSYKAYLFASRAYDAIMRTNQYAYQRDGDHEPDDEHRDVGRTYAWFGDDDTLIKVGVRYYTGIGNSLVWCQTSADKKDRYCDLPPSTLRAHSNVASSFSDFQYAVLAPSDLPTGHSGLIFPFVPDLALRDGATLPDFMNRFFKCAFGADHDEANQYFDIFKSGWGAMVGTSWEAELSHQFWCLGVALEAQSTVRILVDNGGKYLGSIILGGGFRVSFGKERLVSPANHADLIRDLPKSSPHLQALIAIFQHLMYQSAEERRTAAESCVSMHQLRQICSSRGYTETASQEIRAHAPHLSFPDDEPYLTITAHNISRVLEAMANTAIDEKAFPLHHSCILEPSRNARLLSAFGSVAPSFLVPGGRSMNLKNDMSVMRRGAGGRPEQVNVRKIAVLLRPLPEAIRDLNDVISKVEILNPYGSSVVNRISAASLTKTFEGVSFDKIVGGLRAICGVSHLGEEGAGSKRKRDDEDVDNTLKRHKGFDF